MTINIDGKNIADGMLTSLKRRVQALHQQGIVTRLAVVLIGDNPASLNYIARKREAAERVGVGFLFVHLSPHAPPRALIKRINQVQRRNRLSGIIIQLPLPPKLRNFQQEIINAINPELDVDCLTDVSLGSVMLGTNALPPPTPSAVLEILKRMRVPLSGSHVVLVGRGDLIGKPLANLLMRYPLTLTVCGRKSRPLKKFTSQADILVSGVGKANLINGDMVKRGAIVIDAGFSVRKGKILGDIDQASVAPKASFLTPVPGGVGPVTVAKLLENVVTNAERLRMKPNRQRSFEKS